ncbi:MAG: D-alanyl-D-alanine carboxypeptidase [Thermomicrobiales bacterium]|nr:D-alanyl-D-alanine carboxypeptidase [Thermomicrobiales bacterium]
MGLDWSGTAGVFDRSGAQPLTPNATFRIASNTKTFTAAATPRLVEDGKLELDLPIADLLPAEYLQALQGGGYDPEAITLQHLLAHTSRLHDYAEDAAFQETVFAEPQKRWTRLEQVRLR